MIGAASMEAVDSLLGTIGQPYSTRWDLVVADAGWFTTANLFRETPTDRASTLLLRCSDYRVAWSQGKRPFGWNRPVRLASPSLWEQDLVLPTGWMKSYPNLGMRPIARAVRRWRSSLEADGGSMALVITYPYYLHLRRQLRPARLVYYNIDDYKLYWPKAVKQVERLEAEAVRVADLTVCTSRFRAEELRANHPEFASKIRHLPHGAPSSSIPSQPQDHPGPAPSDLTHLPRPWVGYVGTLEDRVDWNILDQVAATVPEASIILVGRVGPDGPQGWQKDRQRCLARGNVHAVGWRDQEVIERYNQSFDLNLIPYRTDHPFNIACCPTKIMDYMAAGRPVVATNLPECRLYSDVFDVVAPEHFAAAVAGRLASGANDGGAWARWELARRESCRVVVSRLLDWLA